MSDFKKFTADAKSRTSLGYWGPLFWEVLRIMAVSVDNDKDNDERRKAFDTFMKDNLGALLPCEDCRCNYKTLELDWVSKYKGDRLDLINELEERIRKRKSDDKNVVSGVLKNNEYSTYNNNNLAL